MLASTAIVSCNFTASSSGCLNNKTPKRHRTRLISKLRINSASCHFPRLYNCNQESKGRFFLPLEKRGTVQICCVSEGTRSLEDPDVEKDDSDTKDIRIAGRAEGRDWTTSILLFFFWAAILYYVFNLAPNQTQSRDLYFVEKLSNLKGDDGFRMNQVLVSLWYIMGLWPLAYSMLLLPTGRSNKSSIPVWPFLTLSFFGGAYALLPYFIIWKPPPPPVDEAELSRWPLNFLESKITAGVIGAVGLGLIVSAGLATSDWKEFYQYFRESKLVHATTLDFSLLSTFAPFWVYNDMTVRRCYDKYSWLLPLSVIPFLGPALYIFLRPSPSTEQVSLETSAKSD
ncbi:hypothetical protein Dimus_019622 [Dionaea muscipula]